MWMGGKDYGREFRYGMCDGEREIGRMESKQNGNKYVQIVYIFIVLVFCWSLMLMRIVFNCYCTNVS